MRKLSTRLVVALAGGLFVAGCGSSSISTTITSAAFNTAAAAEAMARCEQLIVQSTLSTEAKTGLEEICGLGPNSHPAREVECVDLVYAFHAPAGVAMERALAACRVP